MSLQPEDVPPPELIYRRDFSLIGEAPEPLVARQGADVERQRNVELIGLEYSQLSQGKTEYQTEKSQVEIQKLYAELKNVVQDINLRKKFSGAILKYLWAFSAFCGLCLMLQGFSVYGFKLDSTVLVTLVGGTAASAFGLVAVVLGGLFRSVATLAKPNQALSQDHQPDHKLSG